MSYDIGDRVRIGNHVLSGAAAFTAIGDVVTDPTTVTLTIKRADGTSLIYGYPTPGVDGSLTRESTGRFYRDVTCDVPGVWRIKMDGAGSVVASEQTTFTVAGSLILWP
jgi:hypothetical protein